MSESEAISKAKNSREVQNKIADKVGFEFYSTPDWGSCTAKKDYNGGYTVTLKGNISGYTDEYKTDFEYDKKFTAKVTVSSTGSITYISVSTY